MTKTLGSCPEPSISTGWPPAEKECHENGLKRLKNKSTRKLHDDRAVRKWNITRGLAFYACIYIKSIQKVLHRFLILFYCKTLEKAQRKRCDTFETYCVRIQRVLKVQKRSICAVAKEIF